MDKETAEMARAFATANGLIVRGVRPALRGGFALYCYDKLRNEYVSISSLDSLRDHLAMNTEVIALLTKQGRLK